MRCTWSKDYSAEFDLGEYLSNRNAESNQKRYNLRKVLSAPGNRKLIRIKNSSKFDIPLGAKLSEFSAIKLGIFSDFWRRAAHRRQKSKKMLNENLAFFPIFGGVLRTAAKNRKKCLMETWHFFQFLAACYAPPPKIEKNAKFRKLLATCSREKWNRKLLDGATSSPRPSKPKDFQSK